MKGYLKINRRISEAEAEQIKDRWQKAMTGMDNSSRPIILGEGIDWVSLEQKHSYYDPSIVICGYCGQWAAIQTECKHCGAKVL